MKIKTDSIHIEDLMEILTLHYSYFVDEQHRMVDIKHFLTIFTHKYANQIGNFTFWIEYKKKYNELHCQNISGMKFVFPLEYKMPDLTELEDMV
jgi:hypothetical protein